MTSSVIKQNEEAKLSVKTAGPQGWKTVVNAVSTIVYEATFTANEEGISFRGMDPSHVALIDIFWPNTAFESYYCKNEIKFGVNISEFAKLIKRLDKKDNEIEMTILDEDYLQLNTKGDYSRNYKMRLIDPVSSSSTPLPKLSFKSKAVFPIGSLDRIPTDVKVVSEYIEIEISERDKWIKFSGKDDMGDATIILDPNQQEENTNISSLEIEEESKSTYNLAYISRMVKSVSLSTTDSPMVELAYQTKMPLRLGFEFADKGRIHFYLAPRVSD